MIGQPPQVRCPIPVPSAPQPTWPEDQQFTSRSGQRHSLHRRSFASPGRRRRVAVGVVGYGRCPARAASRSRAWRRGRTLALACVYLEATLGEGSRGVGVGDDARRRPRHVRHPSSDRKSQTVHALPSSSLDVGIASSAVALTGVPWWCRRFGELDDPVAADRHGTRQSCVRRGTVSHAFARARHDGPKIRRLAGGNSSWVIPSFPEDVVFGIDLAAEHSCSRGESVSPPSTAARTPAASQDNVASVERHATSLRSVCV